MGKQLQHQDSGITAGSSNPGCMWGILHVLHHHRRHHSRKKILTLKRHGGRKHASGVGNPGNTTKAINASEMQEPITSQEPITGEINAPAVGEKVAEPIPVSKSSMKSRIKALIVEEMSKRRGRHRRSCSYPTRLQLTRTDSIHHLEPSDSNPLSEVTSNDDDPRIILQENEENPSASSSLGPLQSKASVEPVTGNTECEFCELNKTRQDLLLAQAMGNAEEEECVSLHESKQFLDVLEVFNMNKELFMKVLQEPNPPLDHYYYGRRAFNSKMGFTKSMSFPFAKEQKNRQVGILFQKSAELEFSECTSELKEKGSPTALNREENKAGIKGFKSLKQRIKRAMRESRKERHRTTMDAVLHKIPYGRKFSKDEDISGLSSKSSRQNSGETDEKVGLRRMRRISSFNEPMDRYRRLFESSTFNMEAKQHISERIKLRTEETTSPSNTVKNPLGRILSMPDIRSNCYFQSEDSPDANSVGTPTRNYLNSDVGVDTSRVDGRKTSCISQSLENEDLLDASVDKGSQEKSVGIGVSDIFTEDEVGSRSFSYEETEGKVGLTFDDLGRLKSTERDAQNENEIQDMLSPNCKGVEPSPISVLESSQEDMTSPTKFSWSEETDSILKPRSLFSDEPETMDSLANEASMDSSTLAEIMTIPESIETSVEQLSSEFLRILVNTKDAAEFKYVKHVLELSGFSRDELLGTWHSPDQPVDPTLFEEVEGWMVPEPNYPENEGGICNHLLLFDLINEVLLEIYERSFTYWPKALSSNSHMRPIPVGFHVLEEVWANISWYLSWKPEVDLSLDDSVTRDFAKGDGWMNLQFEAECVGLEIEDLIFDDLLEELSWT